MQTNWLLHFNSIRRILNEWNPLGVAGSVEDVYDDINFAAYSALVNYGSVDAVKDVIRNYLIRNIGLNIDDEELTEVAMKIKKAVESVSN